MGLGTKLDTVMQTKTWIVPVRHYLRGLQWACDIERNKRNQPTEVTGSDVETILKCTVHGLLDVASQTMDFPAAEDRLLTQVNACFPWFDPALDKDEDILFYDEVIYSIQVELDQLLGQLLRVDLWSAWFVKIEDGDLFVHYLGDQRVIEWQLQQRLRQYDGDIEKAVAVDYKPRAQANSDDMRFKYSMYGDNQLLKKLLTEERSDLQARLNFSKLPEAQFVKPRLLKISDFDLAVDIRVELGDHGDDIKVVDYGGYEVCFIPTAGSYSMYVDGEVVFTYRTKSVGKRGIRIPVFDRITLRDDFIFDELVRRLKVLMQHKT